MVFWKTYPILRYLQGLFYNSPFIPLQFTKDDIQIPENIGLEIYTKSDKNRIVLKKVLGEIQGFLKSYFGNPPKTPILDIPIKQLLGNKDHIILVRDNRNTQIIGCIRYKYIGKLLISESNPEIYYEDCFCIHPEWRKKGIGDYLLTSLHNYVNQQNIPYSLFLKEGHSLGIIHKPLYSGLYVYTKTSKTSKPYNTEKHLGKLFTLNVQQAKLLISIFEECKINKSLVIINTNNINQNWLLYSKDNYNILICYQDTYQTTINNLFEKNDNEGTKKLGWITAWFETPLIPLNIKQDAINMFLERISKQFDYIWTNSQWIPSECKEWKTDGQFHWYTYQWATNLNLKKNYCITI